MKHFNLIPFTFAALFSSHVAAQVTFPEAGDILYETPEGTLHANQVRDATSFYDPGEGYGCLDSVSFYTADYVVADNGDVYLKNPFTFFPTDTWLKLDNMGDGTLVARLPQAMFEDEDGTVFYARRLSYTTLGDDMQSYSPDESESDVRFTLHGDTLTMVGEGMNEEGLPSVILGLSTASGGWSCYGEGKMSVVPLLYQPTARPEELPTDVHNFSYLNLYQTDETVASVSVRDGNKLYWELPYVSNYDEHYWVMGELTDEGLTVKPQYLGVDSWSCLHLFAVPGKYLEESTELEPYVLQPELKLGYNAATAGYESADEQQVLLINVGDQKVYYSDAYQAPKLLAMPSTGALVNPAPYLEPSGSGQEGCQSVRFEFEPFDVNGGNTLTKDNLYYRVFVDNSTTPFVFRPQTYKGLEKEMTEVPYYFTDQRDLVYDGGGITAGDIKGYIHQFNLYQPFDSVGVQTIYKGAELAQSDIVWIKGSGTSSVSAPQRHADTSSVSYGINGVRMRHPVRKGIVIVRKSDGKVTKEVIR